MAQGGQHDRIDGWKSIAGHLGRDRSTAIRWARDRGLPVHALPGGKSRSVYALAHELNAWMQGQGSPPDAPENPAIDLPADGGGAPVTLAPPDRPRRRWLVLALGGAVLGAGALALAWPGATPATLDAATRARYVNARDDVALRSDARLRDAIATLRDIAHDHPDHGGVQEALAEAWLLAREFGSASDTVAFGEARKAAEAARRADPASAVADRVEGVAAYWWDRDPARAGTAFRRAIAHAPQDALAHLWYANILADNGETAAAMREFDAARMLDPGAPYVQADYGWGLWSAGHTADAVARLTALARRQPELASIHDCLSVMALARGDLAGYASHLRQRARLRGEGELAAYAAAIDRTLAADPSPGHDATYAVMLSRALSYTQNAERPDHSWAAFIASMAGDRAQLAAILTNARARGERWGSAGFVRRIRTRWAGDAAIDTALDGLAQARIEG
jgi:tetratricopeptide (TPR) repeat protein